MTARCKKCNASRTFSNKRGNKLSDMTCNCGGKFELLSSAQAGDDSWVYINRSGEKFISEVVEGIKFRFVKI